MATSLTVDDLASNRYVRSRSCGLPLHGPAGSFSLVFQIVGVALEHWPEVGQRAFDERQHQAREALLHREIGRAIVTRPQLERAHTLEQRRETAGPGHALAGHGTRYLRREGAVRAGNAQSQLLA